MELDGGRRMDSHSFVVMEREQGVDSHRHGAYGVRAANPVSAAVGPSATRTGYLERASSMRWLRQAKTTALKKTWRNPPDVVQGAGIGPREELREQQQRETAFLQQGRRSTLLQRGRCFLTTDGRYLYSGDNPIYRGRL